MHEMPIIKPVWTFYSRLRGIVVLVAAVCVLLGLSTSSVVAQTIVQTTLNAIKERGAVHCGVNGNLPGFSMQGANGAWAGLDVDLCRALAAAIFDDPSKVTFTPLPPETRFAALVSGEIDVLSRNTTWTLAREATLGVQFAAVTYYDGQGFMVRRSRGAASVRELRDTKVCVQSGTTTELNLDDYFSVNEIGYEKIAVPSAAEALQAYSDRRCDVLTSDVGPLHALRLLLNAPDENVILPDVISKEPLGPAVRANDVSWLNVVKWTHYAMVEAEELGISQETLGEAMGSERAEVRRLLGSYAALGQALGLPNNWAARIIRHVGNYGESFDRNLGNESGLGISRGLNRLWTQGGLQYAPPFR